jgi:hypothetical protein
VDLTEHLRALRTYADQYEGSPEAEQIVTGALWAFARVSGLPLIVVREQLDAMRTPLPATTTAPEPLRYYGGMPNLPVTKEAESLAVAPDAPITEANHRSFSALAEAAEAEGNPANQSISAEERAELDAMPETPPDVLAAQLAAARSAIPGGRRH